MKLMPLSCLATRGTASAFLGTSAFLSLSLGASADEPATSKISVVPFVITSQPFPGTTARTDEVAEISRLQEESAGQAIRTLTEHHLAKDAQRVATPAAAQTPLVVTGTLSLPVSATAMNGMGAYGHHGDFAVATATVERPGGQVIASSRITLGWRAGWWITAGKSVRLVSFDTMLADFTRKATDKAVRSVFHDPAVKSLSEKPH